MNKYLKMNKIYAILAFGASLSVVHAQDILTLEKAVELAAQNSPDLKQSELRYEQSDWNLKAQKALQKSSFALGIDPYTYSKTQRFDDKFSDWYTTESQSIGGDFSIRQPLMATDGQFDFSNSLSYMSRATTRSVLRGNDTISETTTNNSYADILKLTFTQPLFTYNQQKLTMRTLVLNAENSQIDYNLKKLNLEVNVANSFYDIYSQQMVIDVATEEAKNNQESYDIIKNKVDAGLAALGELYQAELNLASSKSSLQNKKVQLENMKDNFRVLIGMPLNYEFKTVGEVTMKEVTVNLDKAVNFALENRMELRQRKIDLEKSQFDLIKAKAINEFRGDLKGSIGISANSGSLNTLFDNPERTPTFGLSLSIPLFDWGYRKAKVKAAEISRTLTEMNIQDEKLTIETTIRKSYRNLQNLLSQIEIERQNVKNAELTYQINLEKYKNGDLTSMDLQLQQNQLSTKRINFTQSLINYKIELLNMKIQTLYDFERNTPVANLNLFVKPE